MPPPLDTRIAASRRAAPRQRRPARAPLVQRTARWSARHRKTAVLGWCGVAGAAFLAGQILGTHSLPQYDPGQAGQGEQILHQLEVATPPTESVLIQPRGASAAGLTFADDPQMQQAARQVAAALHALPAAAQDISSPGPMEISSKTPGDPPAGPASDAGGGAAGLVSVGGGSALVTFKVAGPHADADATV